MIAMIRVSTNKDDVVGVGVVVCKGELFLLFENSIQNELVRGWAWDFLL